MATVKPDAVLTTAKVTKIGNSLGVILPKDVLARLKVSAGDSLFLVEAPGGYRLTPYDPEFERQMTIANKIMKEDRDILRELAK
jgi:putative addiction module antidote